jgi:hypothetical protein
MRARSGAPEPASWFHRIAAHAPTRLHWGHFVIALALVAAPFALPSAGDAGASGDVPNIDVLRGDSRLSFHGDRLYLAGEPFSGYLIERYPDGARKSRVPYRQGLTEGLALAWYPDGSRMSARAYVAGKREGVHQGWWENGRPQYRYHFSNDLHEGLAEEYFDDGRLARQFHYRNGAEDGRQRIWDGDGSIRANYIVIDGRRYGSIGTKPCISSLDGRPITPKEEWQ